VTGQPLKGIEYGVYRSMRIKGLIRYAKDGYALTQLGEDMMRILKRAGASPNERP
jgi:hypothetical protein